MASTITAMGEGTKGLLRVGATDVNVFLSRIIGN